MVDEEAVIGSACVAKIQLAVITIPHCLMALMSIAVAVVATMTSVGCFCWKVGLAKSLDRSSKRRSSKPLSTAIISNQLLCKIGTECFETVNSQICVLFAQNKTVCDGQIKKKPENVLVIFATFEAHVVVTSQLIIVIHTTHVLVVDGDRQRTRI